MILCHPEVDPVTALVSLGRSRQTTLIQFATEQPLVDAISTRQADPVTANLEHCWLAVVWNALLTITSIATAEDGVLLDA